MYTNTKLYEIEKSGALSTTADNKNPMGNVVRDETAKKSSKRRVGIL